MRPPFPFDAVLFDLDGTLLATDRYWIPAAREGARRAFEELGLAREFPTDAQWLALVGLPLAQGFERLFEDLDADQRAHVMRCCVEEEHFALTAGKGALLDGARDALTELRARGVRVGVASNCSQAYLGAALREVGLGIWVEEARCLESPGCATKSDMIADLLRTFGTRSACFVGDRATDSEAAHANALPHVHLTGGFAPPGERVESEAELAGLGDLIARLERRGVWIDGVLARLRVGESGGVRVLGIGGFAGAGKSFFARDAARRLEARELEVTVIDGLDEPDAFHELGRRRMERPANALEARLHSARGVVLVSGRYLHDPRLRGSLDALLQLDVPPKLCRARLFARDALRENRANLLLLFQYRMMERHAPADLRVDASNPLGPAVEPRERRS